MIQYDTIWYDIINYDEKRKKVIDWLAFNLQKHGLFYLKASVQDNELVC